MDTQRIAAPPETNQPQAKVPKAQPSRRRRQLNLFPMRRLPRPTPAPAAAAVVDLDLAMPELTVEAPTNDLVGLDQRAYDDLDSALVSIDEVR